MSDLLGVVRIAVQPQPLKRMLFEFTRPAGQNVEELLRTCGCDLVVDGRLQALVSLEEPGLCKPLPAADWGRVVPAAGQTVAVHVVPGKGGGGGGGKDPMRTVMTIAVVAAAMWVAPYAASYFMYGTTAWASVVTATTAGALLTASIGAGALALGMMGVNAISPVQQPSLRLPSSMGGLSGLDGGSKFSSITGMQNHYNPWGKIPDPYGKVGNYKPARCVTAYQETVGDEVYWRTGYCIGYGPCRLSEHKIGDTPVSTYGSDIEMQILEGWSDDPDISLYPDDVHEESFGVALTKVGGAVTRRSAQSADEMVFDISFRGLGRVQSTTPTELTVQFSVRIRPVGGAWQDWPEGSPISVTAATTDVFTRGFRAKMPSRGQYDLELIRITDDPADLTYMSEASLSALRTITCRPPVRRDLLPPLCFVFMRIRSGVLSGQLDRYNCTVERYLPVWDGETWAYEVTGSPSWAYVNGVRGPACKRPAEDSQLDLDEFIDWAAACAAAGLEYNNIVDYRTTQLEHLKKIAACGRASFGKRDGLYTVVRDGEQAAQANQFTPRNSVGHELSREWPDPAHALRCSFINAEAGYELDEMVVYAPGQAEETATNFEDFEQEGCVWPAQMADAALYKLACAEQRPEAFVFTTSWEWLRSTRGSRVGFVCDVFLIGLYSARIRYVGVDGDGSLTGVAGSVMDCELDDDVVMEAGVSYGLKYRGKNGIITTRSVVTEPGQTRILTFTDPIPPFGEPPVGDDGTDGGELCTFGEAGLEDMDVLIESIDPGPDFTAQLTVVPYAWAEIQAVMAGGVPEYQTQISRAPRYQTTPPPRPAVRSVVSDETVLLRTASGALLPRIQVAFDMKPYSGLPVDGFQVQVRLASTGLWRDLPILPATSRRLLVENVTEGAAYDIQIRASAAGLAGDWAEILGHTVVGKSTPPPDPSGLLVDGRTLRWTYPPTPLDFGGSRVAYHLGLDDHRDTAIPLHDGDWKDTTFTLPLGLTGVVTVLVWSVDTSGNPSTGVARAILGLGDILPNNVLETLPLIPSPIAAEETTVCWTEDSDPAWTGNNDPAWSQLYAGLILEVDVRVPATLANCRAWLDPNLAGLGLSVEYRTDSTAPYWTDDSDPAWGADSDSAWDELPDWRSWPGALEQVRPMLHQFRVSALAGAEQAQFDSCDLVFDVEDQSEDMLDVTISTAGTRLALTKNFDVVKYVRFTVQDNGLGATGVLVKDKDAVFGPLLQAQGADALIDATVVGYHRRTL